MGSGISGNYNGTRPTEAFRKIANFYHVTKDMLEKDKKDPDIYNPTSGYFKNPTSTNLSDAIKEDKVYIKEKRMHGTVPYVLTCDDKILFGKRVNPNNPTKRSPHPTLIGGRDPIVKCAGMITFSKGKIVSMDNQSGHFKPNIESMKYVDNVMKKLYQQHPGAFSNKSKWRKNDDNN